MKCSAKVKDYFSNYFIEEITNLLVSKQLSIPHFLWKKCISFKGIFYTIAYLIEYLGVLFYICGCTAIIVGLFSLWLVGNRYIVGVDLVEFAVYAACTVFVITAVFVTYHYFKNIKTLLIKLWIKCIESDIKNELDKNIEVYKEDGKILIEFIDEAHFYFASNIVVNISSDKLEKMHCMFVMRGIRGLMSAINECNKPAITLEEEYECD
jgi:hypothetical protein